MVQHHWQTIFLGGHDSTKYVFLIRTWLLNLPSIFIFALGFSGHLLVSHLFFIFT